MLDELKQSFSVFDEEYFQKAKLDNSRLLRETDSWLDKTTSILEAQVITALQQYEKVPHDLINTEEIDKTMVLADSLRSKIFV
jgi:hypothetical protein